MIKRLICGGILAGLADTELLLAEAEIFMEPPNKMHDGWDKTIFCIVDDPELENELEKCARDLDCEILFDWPNSPEIVFNHHFVAVVDGGVIDEVMWDIYVELSNDGDIKVPCLMVGNAEHLKMPEFGKNKVIRFDRTTCNTPEDIASAIKTIKNNIDRRGDLPKGHFAADRPI